MMGELASMIVDLEPTHWFALAALLIGIEMIMPTQYLMWPGIAAAVVGGLSLLVPMTWPVETGLFGALSAALVGVARFWFPGTATQTPSRLNQRMDQIVGKPAIVQDNFVHGQGAVTLGDSRWSAQCADGSDLPAGTKVTVVSADSTLLTVKRVSDPRQ